ncbi:hypothetical protein ALT_4879 [Aspergillus lentulus]|uniref:WD-like domain-containing protein n=1 Tax=Aspergillus lentulus TaxID=293939 RepID=A0AAN6BLP4_ASPLE|nr:hypothetical protein CNMCM6069_005477 [Aspergillus lentulus]KAF4162546.1 hypothetical protein CNMCM6936_001975 [Aspergillus lentulus]KAF4175081.1 hypothetical protein CNMCM8060_007775 [Aspergillus lentulus]KAF4186969.1 hypothetical protein CNMCM7927_004704 [Aspergillus lentulus]KAF4196248.1 hypothetical protein CNMCM8694_005342 [Aspergillus lentulus]
MHFNNTILMLVSVLALGVIASPVPEQNAARGWVEHYRETGKSGGTLIYYGPQDGAQTDESEANSLEQRSCGYTSKAPVCDSSNGARNANCNALVSDLWDNSDVAISETPRQICYQGDSGKNTFCCVSWHNPIPGLKKGDLAPYASAILSQCTQNGISGKTSTVLVHNKCTNVCVSNRGTHC